MIRSALKSLQRAPGLAIAAVLCLALGAAATSAVATLVGALLLRPLPFPDADRLVRVWFEERDVSARISLSIPEFDDFKQVAAFDTFIGTARVRVGTPRQRCRAVSWRGRVAKVFRSFGTAAIPWTAAHRR